MTICDAAVMQSVW